MCGLSGFYSKKLTKNPEIILEDMLQMIDHRGRDNRGIYINRVTSLGDQLGFGHNRLSIIDLSDKGNQPYSYKNYVLAFNGEIYNYVSLKNQLEKKGYTFESTSDTEVLVKLFDCFGKKAFEMLNGMYAIAIYDILSKKIYLVRDRMGVKPLYYFSSNDCFLFSSELKSFWKFPNFKNKTEIDKQLLANYFKYGYINSFNSIFKGVNKVENGAILTYDITTNEINSKKYWELRSKAQNQINNLDEAVNELYELLDSSIKFRLVSDVPVGLFLSSGLDSNLVLKLALSNGLEKLNTFTLKSLDYEENNIEYNNQVTRKFIFPNPVEIWKDFKYLCSMYDEPFSDTATIGLYQLAKTASQFNKVILVGDGGDELLAGYNSYKAIAKFNNNKIPIIIKYLYSLLNPVLEFYLSKTITKSYSYKGAHYHSLMSSFSPFEYQVRYNRLLNDFTDKIIIQPPNKTQEPKFKGNLLELLNYQSSTSLLHQLNYKTDIAGMLNTVEIREPLLDYRLFEFQQRISIKLLNEMVSSNQSKLLFRQIMEKKFNFDQRKLTKKGFHIGINQIFKQNSEEIEVFISNHKSRNIDMNYVKKLWISWKKNKIHSLIITRIISFVYWESKILNDYNL